jgi:hypothetical protein
MLTIAVQSITVLELPLGDVGGDGVHGVGGEAGLGELPAHRDVAGAVGAVAVVGSSLVVGNVFIDPVLGTGNHRRPGHAFKVIGQVGGCLGGGEG